MNPTQLQVIHSLETQYSASFGCGISSSRHRQMLVLLPFLLGFQINSTVILSWLSFRGQVVCFSTSNRFACVLANEPMIPCKLLTTALTEGSNRPLRLLNVKQKHIDRQSKRASIYLLIKSQIYLCSKKYSSTCGKNNSHELILTRTQQTLISSIISKTKLSV